jgi:hypothetical protein
MSWALFVLHCVQADVARWARRNVGELIVIGILLALGVLGLTGALL